MGGECEMCGCVWSVWSVQCTKDDNSIQVKVVATKSVPL